MTCKKCGASRIRRQMRRGFFQTKIFPWFGLYPWECHVCRKVCLYRARTKPNASGLAADRSDSKRA